MMCYFKMTGHMLTLILAANCEVPTVVHKISSHANSISKEEKLKFSTQLRQIPFDINVKISRYLQ